MSNACRSLPSLPQKRYRAPRAVASDTRRRRTDTHLLGAVQDQRRSLGSVAVLVRIGRDRRHTGQTEVPQRHREASDRPMYARTDGTGRSQTQPTTTTYRCRTRAMADAPYPSISAKGSRNPPRQPSTCRPTLCFRASLLSASMSSITPCGNSIAEPTIYAHTHTSQTHTPDVSDRVNFHHWRPASSGVRLEGCGPAHHTCGLACGVP